VLTGTISSRNLPCPIASSAFRWLWKANWSWSSRVTWYCAATFSAVSPIGRNTSGRDSRTDGLKDGLFPPMGTMVIDSTPPAMMMSSNPAMIRSAAIAID